MITTTHLLLAILVILGVIYLVMGWRNSSIRVSLSNENAIETRKLRGLLMGRQINLYVTALREHFILLTVMHMRDDTYKNDVDKLIETVQHELVQWAKAKADIMTNGDPVINLGGLIKTLGGFEQWLKKAVAQTLSIAATHRLLERNEEELVDMLYKLTAAWIAEVRDVLKKYINIDLL